MGEVVLRDVVVVVVVVAQESVLTIDLSELSGGRVVRLLWGRGW